jgi:hypothetical protein
MHRFRSDCPPIQIAARMPARPISSSTSLSFDIISHLDLHRISDPDIWTIASSSNPALDHQNETGPPLLLDQQYLAHLFHRHEAVHRSLLPGPRWPPTQPTRDDIRDWRSLQERTSYSFRTKRDPAPQFKLACYYKWIDHLLPFPFDDRPSFQVAWRNFNEVLSERLLVRSHRDPIANLRDDDASDMLDVLQTVGAPDTGVATPSTQCSPDLQWLMYADGQDPLRQTALYLLVKVAATSQRLPDSIFIRLSAFKPTKRTYAGGGGFAHVYRATYRNQQVAVKVLKASYDTSAAVRLVSFLFLRRTASS